MYARTIHGYTTSSLLTIPSPMQMSLPDICAHLNRALPLLRVKLHASSRQRLRRQASDHTRRMMDQAISHKIKSAIRYTIGSKVPHYDFTSIRSDTDEIFFNPADVHNVTTKHFSDHFKAPDTSPNFTINHDNAKTLASSKALFMTHPNHHTIFSELKELLWQALTRPQEKLGGQNGDSTLRD
jgi:hypothetical protein